MNPSENRGYLTTEQSNPRSADLDVLSTDDLVKLFIDEDRKPQLAVEGASGALSAAIDAVALRLSRGGRLFYIGAGTSGRLGVLDAAECPPTFCSPPELVQGVLAGGAPALPRALPEFKVIATSCELPLRRRALLARAPRALWDPLLIKPTGALIGRPRNGVPYEGG